MFTEIGIAPDASEFVGQGSRGVVFAVGREVLFILRHDGGKDPSISEAGCEVLNKQPILDGNVPSPVLEQLDMVVGNHQVIPLQPRSHHLLEPASFASDLVPVKKQRETVLAQQAPEQSYRLLSVPVHNVAGFDVAGVPTGFVECGKNE